MASIFGHLNVSDGDRAFNAVAGQRAIFDAVTAYMNRINAELNSALSVFLSHSTDAFKYRFYLPASGYLQRRGPDGRYGGIKAAGSWDVAFPLEDMGAQIVGNDVDMAYMTVGELNRHIQGVAKANINSVRYEVLRRLLNNADRTFVDPRHGSLTVMSLANGDAVVYPPVVDSDTEATESHMYYTGYATASISDTNDPIATLVSELDEHFGQTEKVAFINTAEKAKIAALTKFTKVVPSQINPASTTATVAGTMPNVPGTIIGFHSDGCWVSQWDRVPATYILGVSLEEEPPLVRRIDPADTGLGDGLQLVAVDEDFPFVGSFWRHRFGLGVGNRLNGVVLQTHTATGYDIPSGYTY